MTSVITESATLNKFEKFKAEKDGLAVKSELEHFAQIGWEAMDETDRNHRLKWLGIFFRPVTPGKFMMRLRLPSGIITSQQMRVLAEIVQRYGEDGNADITTRQNLQLRGIRIEDAPDILRRLKDCGLTSIQSGMDNVRNITASPVAGLDADELIDVRDLVQQVQDMITNGGEGNPEFTNLPRKFNIAIEGGKDNSVHAEINDIAFVPAYQLQNVSHPAQDTIQNKNHGLTLDNETAGFWYIRNQGLMNGEKQVSGNGNGSGSDNGNGNGNQPQTITVSSSSASLSSLTSVSSSGDRQLGFNVLVGGFFSAKRCEAAIPMNVWVDPTEVVGLCRAILEVYRDHGLRANRQKARLMWLIDEWGIERFRSEVEQRFGKELSPAAPKDEIDWEKRDHIGVYKQKQPGLNYVGMHIPVGRLFASDMFEVARLAEVYGNGELRLTVEQNIIIANLPDSRLNAFLQEPILERFAIAPGTLARSLVSCTGAQFCNFALIETKNRAQALIKEIDTELTLSQSVRIHWTGCPNSCGQPQVADIGLMGTKARKNGKAVEGVDIFMGGKVGKDAHLGTCVRKGVACEDLKPVLHQLLIEQFGAQLKSGGLLESAMGRSFLPDSPVSDSQGSDLPANEIQAKPATLVFAKSGQEIACTTADLVLDVAEQAGISLDSSCRGGSCGTCKQKLLQGDIQYEGSPTALSEAEQASGWILTCSARPLGRVVIDA